MGIVFIGGGGEALRVNAIVDPFTLFNDDSRGGIAPAKLVVIGKRTMNPAF
ncbi:hypothetical protein M2010_004187 [Providencia stuartii]|uniref:hypothetical protein n=1 Tax=Providencia stuartii TaxID=588 RepID=UPI00198783E5|nr:hypothetical protein [Providencia stuartii]GHC07462.1 hypothetical protein GCM10007290_40300 [Providencia thailandensis]